jgi:hypothetical protein
MYPRWIYYPRSTIPAPWCEQVASAFLNQRGALDTIAKHNKSNDVLQIVRLELEALGFRVEGGVEEPTIHRPVLFGEGGKPEQKYQIDAYHPEGGIGLEVEAGRSLRGNAIYRDLIQASLMVDVQCFALCVPLRYRFNVKGKECEDKPYEATNNIVGALYASGRLQFPFKGLLLLGY